MLAALLAGTLCCNVCLAGPDEDAEELVKRLDGIVERHDTAPGKPLKGIFLSSVKLNAPDMNLIARLPKLEVLVVDNCELTEASLSELSAAPQLMLLELSGCRLAPAHFDAIARIPRLAILNLTRTSTTDDDLKRLVPSPRLEDLTLNYTRVTDRGMPTLKMIQHLDELAIFETDVTDEGLKTIAEFRRLRTLVVSDLSITAKGLSSLAASESLRSVRLAFSKFDAEQMKKICAALAPRTLKAQPFAVDPDKEPLAAALLRLNLIDASDLRILEAVDPEMEYVLPYRESKTSNRYFVRHPSSSKLRDAISIVCADNQKLDARVRAEFDKLLAQRGHKPTNEVEGRVTAPLPALREAIDDYRAFIAFTDLRAHKEFLRLPAPGSGPRKPVPPRLDGTGDPIAPAYVKRLQSEWAKFLGVPVEIEIDLGAGQKLPLVLVPPGRFAMGASDRELRDGSAADREGPRHLVEVTRPLYVAKFATTRGQFRRFCSLMNYRTEAERDRQGFGWDPAKRAFVGPQPGFSWQTPGFPQADTHPVVNVSRNDAGRFCAWLTHLPAKPRGTLEARLLREAEWEYCARAGSATRYGAGDERADLLKTANIADASLRAKDPKATSAGAHDDGYPFTAPVGKFSANALGLYDILGNVAQWCDDAPRRYSGSPRIDPYGYGDKAVHRGGSFRGDPHSARCAARSEPELPSACFADVGFRICLVIDLLASRP